MKYVKIAGACLNQTPLDWGGNLENIMAAIDLAKQQKVAILCLPEMAISGYGCEDAFFSDYVRLQTLDGLRQIVAASIGIVVSVGLAVVFENSLYNVVCLIENRKILGFVAKHQLAGDGIHYEPRWFKSWPKGRVAYYTLDEEHYPIGDVLFEIDGVRIGFEICEDAWNGVRPALGHYLHNVDIILNPSASHFAFGKTDIRRSLVCETSRSFSCAYIYSNLLGNEAGRVIYDGEIIIAQGGALLAQNRRFSFEKAQIISAVIDIDVPRRQKKKSFSFNPTPPQNLVPGRMRLPQSTETLSPRLVLESTLTKEEEFYQAVTLGLFDYMRKSFSRGFVVSLSGGADSSACAVLAAHSLLRAKEELGYEALKARLPHLSLSEKEENFALNNLLFCAYQGTANSSDETRNSAARLAVDIGADFEDWHVETLLAVYRALGEKALKRNLDWQTDDLALQNIQARVRAPGIWLMANVRGALLLATSNRSEAAVGYATMDGDTAGGLAPLGGIDKAFLLKWLIWAEENLGIKALSFVNRLKPSAELRPQEQAQTDEADLMPYPILDQIEKCAIRDYKSPLETFMTLRGIVSDEVLKNYIVKFYTLWARNQWKRERYAPSFHLDDENLDPRTWCRFPILSGGYRAELRELMEYKPVIQN